MAYTCGLSKTSTYGSSVLENYGWRITNLFSTRTACDLWLPLLLVILRSVWIRKGDVISWITVDCRLCFVDRCEQSWISCFIDNEHRFIISKLIFGFLAPARI